MDISNIIEEWYEDSGGAGLPEVSAEDNGDVLTVVDGEWDKATPNIDVYRIKAVYDEELDDNVYIADVPFFEYGRTPSVAIVYNEEREEIFYWHVGNFKFERFAFIEAGEPNLYVGVLSPDGDDETGKIFKLVNYDGNITLTP